jgi:ketosteroid isomerase-like protein
MPRTLSRGNDGMADRPAKETVLAALDAIYSRDAAGAAMFYHDDVEYIGYAPIEFFPGMGFKRGKADLMSAVTSLHQRYSSMRHEIEFIAAEDDTVATLLRVHMRKQENARIVQFQVANFFRLKDGLIAQQRQFIDSFDVLQQVMEVDLGELLARLRR